MKKLLFLLLITRKCFQGTHIARHWINVYYSFNKTAHSCESELLSLAKRLSDLLKYSVDTFHCKITFILWYPKAIKKILNPMSAYKLSTFLSLLSPGSSAVESWRSSPSSSSSLSPLAWLWLTHTTRPATTPWLTHSWLAVTSVTKDAWKMLIVKDFAPHASTIYVYKMYVKCNFLTNRNKLITHFQPPTVLLFMLYSQIRTPWYSNND